MWWSTESSIPTTRKRDRVHVSPGLFLLCLCAVDLPCLDSHETHSGQHSHTAHVSARVLSVFRSVEIDAQHLGRQTD